MIIANKPITTIRKFTEELRQVLCLALLI